MAISTLTIPTSLRAAPRGQGGNWRLLRRLRRWPFARDIPMHCLRQVDGLSVEKSLLVFRNGVVRRASGCFRKWSNALRSNRVRSSRPAFQRNDPRWPEQTFDPIGRAPRPASVRGRVVRSPFFAALLKSTCSTIAFSAKPRADRPFNSSVSCSIRCHGTASAAPMMRITAAPNRIWHLAASEISSRRNRLNTSRHLSAGSKSPAAPSIALRQLA